MQAFFLNQKPHFVKGDVTHPEEQTHEGQPLANLPPNAVDSANDPQTDRQIKPVAIVGYN